MVKSITQSLKTEVLIGIRGRGKFGKNSHRDFRNFEITDTYSNRRGVIVRLVFYDGLFKTREPGHWDCSINDICDYQYKGHI